MYMERRQMYEQLESRYGSKVLVYVTGDRRQLETKISSEVVDFFVDHLDRMGVVPRISLILYTRGGDTLAAWSLVNLLKTFTDQLQVVVPSKAQSAGTLIALGADSIVMTKQATLGPIDPSVNGPLNPTLTGGQPGATVPVSVENVGAFVEFARSFDSSMPSEALAHLVTAVNPLVLGSSFRARSQIRMLAHRLLDAHMSDKEAMEQVLDFLCGDSGSHDYTINRREAADVLHLPIAKPTEEEYAIIKSIYDNISDELLLTVPYDPSIVLAGQATQQYTLTRALIESVDGGSHAFQTEGTLHAQSVEVQPGISSIAIQDSRTFEGWRHSGDHVSTQ